MPPSNEHERLCKSCSKTKPLDEFSSYFIGNVRYHHRKCVRCRAQEYLRSGTCKKKRAFVNRLRDRPCVDCVQSFPRPAMWLVHARGIKLFPLGMGWTGRSMEMLQAEAEKNDTVCSNCVRIRMFNTRRSHKRRVSMLAQLPPELSQEAPDPTLAKSASPTDSTTSEV